jgi:predicted aspartyl protease
MLNDHRKRGIMDEMSIFRTTLEVEAFPNSGKRVTLADVMVDTGSEYTWIPEEVLAELGVAPVRLDRFRTADGRILERRVGFAVIYASGRSAAAMVVFAAPGEMLLLGATGLESLNLRVDLMLRELIPAGPIPVAAAA